MSDTEIGGKDVQELNQLKQAATRRKGRGFAGTGDATEVHGAYDTLKGDGPGAQRSIDVCFVCLKSFFERLLFQGWTIFVSGINEEVVEEDMMDKLQEYGKVINMHLNLDRRTGYLKGYCIAQCE